MDDKVTDAQLEALDKCAGHPCSRCSLDRKTCHLLTESAVKELLSIRRQAQEAPKADHVDDLLLQEIESLKEKLKIAANVIHDFDPLYDTADFLHRVGSVDFAQFIEEENQAQEAPKAASQSAEDIDKSADALTYILSALAKNIWMGIKGEKEYIRAVGEFEGNAIEHIHRYFDEIASAQRQAGREEAEANRPHFVVSDLYAAVVEAAREFLKEHSCSNSQGICQDETNLRNALSAYDKAREG